MPFWNKENYSDASPTCTNCGAVYPRDARFCPQCGGKVEAPPAPAPSKPKKSESEKKEYKTLTGSVWMTDEEVDAAIKQNAGKLKGFQHEVEGKTTTRKKRKRTPAEKQKTLEAMSDIGCIGTFGVPGLLWTGRKQRQRREKAQADRIEKLLIDIKNKK